MTLTNRDQFGKPGGSEAEETLRMIAQLRAPEGIEERVKAAIKSAPRAGAVVSWPGRSSAGPEWRQSGWFRGAAAAAIVAVVVGGGWEISSRFQPAAAPQAIAMPRVVSPGGFSNANAIRTPQTLNGPVIPNPVTPEKKKPMAHAAINANHPLSSAKRKAVPHAAANVTR
jgi:hypothetical protein